VIISGDDAILQLEGCHRKAPCGFAEIFGRDQFQILPANESESTIAP
jgi:hypothetical protein